MLPRPCRVWSPDFLASLPIDDFTSSAYKSLEELLFNPFCCLRELSSLSSERIEKLNFHICSCQQGFNSSTKVTSLWQLKGKMSFQISLLVLLHPLFPLFSLVLQGAGKNVEQALWFQRASPPMSALCYILFLVLNLPDWPPKCSTFIWDSWHCLSCVQLTFQISFQLCYWCCSKPPDLFNFFA